MTEQPPQPPSSNPPPPPPGGGYPPRPGGGYPPPPPPGGYPPPPQGGGYPPPPPGAGYQQPGQGGGYPSAGAGYPSGGQPVGTLPQQAYTSWIHRVAAALIDAIPSAVILAIGYGIAFGTADNTCVNDTYGYGVYCSSSMSGLGVAILGLAWLASIAYWIWNWGYRQGTTGSSIGKSVLKFKVVSEATGQPIGFGMSIVRQLAHIIDSLICYIGYLFPLWDSKRQTLADKIMGTVCLPLNAQELNPQPLPPSPPQR